MYHEHNAQTEIRGYDEATQLNYVLQVGASNYFGHQRQNTVRCQLHHQTNQFHHPALQGIDSDQHALAFRRIIFQQLQCGNTEECSEDNHADNRRRVSSGQIGKRVFRDKRQHQLRNAEVSYFANIVGFNRVQTSGFGPTLHQTFRGQAEQVGHQNPYQRGNQRSKQQRTDGQEADFT